MLDMHKKNKSNVYLWKQLFNFKIWISSVAKAWLKQVSHYTFDNLPDVVLHRLKEFHFKVNVKKVQPIWEQTINNIKIWQWQLFKKRLQEIRYNLININASCTKKFFNNVIESINKIDNRSTEKRSKRLNFRK